MTLEEIKQASIDVVERRMTEIRGIDLDSVSDFAELDKEIDALNERARDLEDVEKRKQEMRNKINSGIIQSNQIPKPLEERTKLTKENYLSSQEYRTGFMKRLLGRDITVEERTALSMADTENIIPTQLQNEIITKAKEYAPILNDITLLNVNGNVKFAIEGVVNEAKAHNENERITAEKDTFVEVTLSTNEIVKMIQISSSVKSMSIPAFETWLVNSLAESVAMKIEKVIFKGTGISEAKGIDKITWENDKNAVEIEADKNTTANDIYKLFGLLADGYARNARVYCSRKTLFQDLLGLQDKSKNDLIIKEGGTYYLLGTKIDLTASVDLHEVILGDPKKYAANMPESTTVKAQYDIDTNSYKYLGVAQFDGKPGIEKAFVKLVKKSV